jgi:glucose-6-phosphate isomerase
MDDALQQAWHGVTALAARPEASAIRPLFAADPQRFARYSHRGGGLFLDMSKTAITDAARTALLGVARAARVAERRDAMVRGDLLNVTERRAALHMALRGRVAAREPRTTRRAPSATCAPSPRACIAARSAAPPTSASTRC